MIKIYRNLLPLLAVATLASCEKYNYVKEVSTAEKKENERIYGEVDGPAKHQKNTYPDDPDQISKSVELRKKIFNVNYVTSTYDNTAKDHKAPEADVMPDNGNQVVNENPANTAGQGQDAQTGDSITAAEAKK